MANHTDRWYFSKEKIQNSPSIKDGIELSKELGYRQQCANLMQDIGQRLQVNQLVINTAIVYMHRFYMYHSFQKYHRNVMAPCFVFLAAKVEEMPRKLEHVLKASHVCLKKDEPTLDVKSDDYMQLSQELVNNESVLLQTLGFEVSVDHPNTFVVKCAQLVKASKELAQTAYFLATNSLHLTTFCVQYKPTLVACVCIYVSCLWANYIIPESDGKNWFEFIEPTCTKKQLEELSSYFIKILDSCPTRLKKRLTSGGAVVYKEGKVIPKQESSGKDKTDSAPSSNSKNNNTNNNNSTTKLNSNNNSDTAKPTKSISKTHLTGMLKPQSHEATPPPSSSGSRASSHHNHSSSHIRKHEDKHHESSATKPPSHKDTKQHKTHEQQRMEHKRKTHTPEQIEEYKKRKEREKKLQYYQKMYKDQENEKHQQSNGNSKDNNSTTPQKSHRPVSHTESPAKRQKLNNESLKNPHDLNNKTNTDTYRKNLERASPAGLSKLSSSGSDSEPVSNRNHISKHKSSSQKTNHNATKPQPIPSMKMNGNSQPPGSSNVNSRYNNNLPPPPPPPVATKYS